jgi:hypothetical protein
VPSKGRVCQRPYPSNDYSQSMPCCTRHLVVEAFVPGCSCRFSQVCNHSMGSTPAVTVCLQNET